MARYEVQHAYRSNDYGPFEKGTQIELDPAEAAWINTDSPGTLVEIDPEAQSRAKRERRQAEVAKRAEARQADKNKAGGGDGGT